MFPLYRLRAVAGNNSLIGGEKVKVLHRGKQSPGLDIARAVVMNLDGADSGRGELEALTAGVDKQHAAFGKLVAMLAVNGILSVPQIQQFMPYDYTVED
jgi:hypothetical protein